MGKKNKTGVFLRIAYTINNIFLVLLLLAYGASYIAPSKMPFLSVLALFVPLLLVVNFLFLLWWLIRGKRKWFWTTLILILGFNHIKSFVRFEKEQELDTQNSFSVMSYNVRLFNAYNWIKDGDISNSVVDLILKEDADVVCLQEFHADKQHFFQKKYPFQYKVFRSNKNKIGQVIFSKHPFSNRGSLNFRDTGNNTIFTDVVYKKDTLRIYNVHLESLHIRMNKTALEKESSERLYGRIKKSFIKQEEQLQACVQDFEKHGYKKIICADLNNVAYSYVYQQLSADMQDSFVASGRGFGATHEFPFFPFRIDMIFADSSMEVASFKTIKKHYSDHYPIISTLNW